MADEQATPDSQANIPPKASISTAPTIRLAKPTIQLRRPGDPAPAVKIPTPAAPAAAPAAPAPAAAPAAAPAPAAPIPPTIKAEPPVAKSSTTRIPLPEGGVDGGATVQIKPAAAPAAPAAPTIDIQAAKSKTSRISLDSALGGIPGAAPVAGAPKTIRLKRPGEVSAPAAPAAPLPVATPISAAAAHQTSRLPTSKLATAKLSDVAAAAAIEPAAEEAPLTRRKTIKVRRPGAAGGPHISVNAAPDAGANGEAPAAEGATDDSQPWTAPQGAFKPVVAADTAHWTFIVAACLSIIVTLATIVVLASQAFGPNTSLTEFSSWPTGPDISLSGSYVP